ncbi:MAG: PKD domain-containing protein [Pseudomonadota bacterium]
MGRDRLRLLVPVLSVLMLSCVDEGFVEVENQPPRAVLAIPTQAPAGEPMACDGSGSSDPDGSIASYRWDFGDGASAQGAVVSHIYNAAGDFTVSLTVVDNAGAEATARAFVHVTQNADPVAVLEGPAVGVVNEVLSFTGASSTDSDGVIQSHDWYASDGSSSSGASFDHAFASAGSFTVTLTVTDDQGGSDEDSLQVEVSDLPPSYSGTWTWTLVNESTRNQGLLCGTFQDSTLIINSTPPSISITEQAGSNSVVYTGTISGADFDVSNSQLTITQRIWGTFTSATGFSGWYSIDPGITTCVDREVRGIKS